MDTQSAQSIDQLDAELLAELRLNPRIGILELSRRLDVARGTVQSRLDRLIQSQVITGFGPDLNLESLGFTVKAFVTVDVKQGQIDSVVKPLAAIPEVLEVQSVAAQGDLLCQVAAQSNEHLMEVLEQILAIPDTARTTTAIVLKTQVSRRSHQLIEQLVAKTR